ncbi:hypothetical protein B0H19DRAFT_1267657 [Mycena capillaripes]|nr:hypothetical protein B0H19DRAFT_1267657 [Mycena capillaripes]
MPISTLADGASTLPAARRPSVQCLCTPLLRFPFPCIPPRIACIFSEYIFQQDVLCPLLAPSFLKLPRCKMTRLKDVPPRPYDAAP